MRKNIITASMAGVCLTGGLSALEFGKLDVTQLNTTNNPLDDPNPAVSISVAPGSSPKFAVFGANRGDYNVDFGTPDDLLSGAMITAVRENGRDNSAGGEEPGLVYATSFSERGGDGRFYIPIQPTPLGAGEFNINVAAVHFPFAEEWLAGHSRNSSGTNAGVQNELVATPGISIGEQFKDDGGGVFTLDLTGITNFGSLATSQNGVLLVTGHKNEDNFALSSANDDGTFTIKLKDNGSNGSGTERDPVAFAYVPVSKVGPDLVSALGRILSDGSAEVSGGNFTVTKLEGPIGSDNQVTARQTTGTFTANAKVITTAVINETASDIEVADATGIESGQRVSGPGIPDGTNVEFVSGKLVGLSAAVTESGTDVELTFTATSADDVHVTVAQADGIQVGQKVSGSGIAEGTTVTSVDGTSIGINQAVTESGTDVSLGFATPGRWLLQVAGKTDEKGTLIVSPSTGGVNNEDNVISYEWNEALAGWVIESRDISPGNGPLTLEDGAVADEEMFSFVFFTTEPDNAQPVVSVSSPAFGAAVTRGSSVTITVDASDAAPGSIAQVEIYLNGELVATDTEAPYEYTTSSYDSLVNVTVEAIAQDNEGARTTSSQTYYSIVPPAGSGGMYFNGVDDYVELGDPDALDLSTFTLETWFHRVGQGTPTGTGGYSVIPLVTKGRGESDQSNVDMNYFLGIDAETGVLVADFEDINLGTNIPIAGRTPVAMDEWQHAAVTYDGVEWRLYLNGNLEGVLATDGLQPRFDSIQPGALGSALNSENEPAGFFHGYLDEVRIWDSARSQTELRAGVNFEIPAEEGLVARWGMTEGSGTSLTSTASGSLVGTLISEPVWAAGKGFNSNMKPAVDITSPLGGERFLFGDSIALTVSASDPDGSISQIEFFDNGVSIGTDTTAPYELNYANAPLGGLHRLSAVATDNGGEISISDLVIVDVTLPAPMLPGFTLGVIDGGDLDADIQTPADPAVWVIESTTASPRGFDNPGSNTGDLAVNVNGAPVPVTSGLMMATNYSSIGNLGAIDNMVWPYGATNYTISSEDNENPGASNPATPEESSRFSLGYFPYADGWVGGNFDVDGVVRDGSSNLPEGVTITQGVTGRYEITGLPTSGNLLGFSVGNGNDNVAAVAQLDDSWVVSSRDNSGGLQYESFGFLYVPTTARQVYSGLVRTNGELVMLNDDLEKAGASVNLGTQGYEITIGDGSVINPSNSVMFISADFDEGNAGDNIMSYSAVGNVFVVFSQDLPGLNSQFQTGGFRFLIAPIDSVVLNGDEVSIQATDGIATENSDDDILLTFRREGDSSEALTVPYALGGTATEGSDYPMLPKSVTFPAGVDLVQETISANGDVELETDETIIITLLAGEGYSLGVFGSATVTLKEGAPEIPTTTLTFQEGVDGYTGQFEMAVNENGSTTLGSEVQQYYLDGTPGNAASNDTNNLLRFDNLFGDGPNQIPPGAEVIDARLFITTTSGGDSPTGGPYLVDRLLVEFDENTTYAQLGIDTKPTTFDGFEGARGSSTRAPVSGFGAMTHGDVGEADVTKLVQAWAKGEQNFGFSIYTGGTSDGWQVNTVGNTNPVLRPKLQVTYTTLAVKEYLYPADLSAILNTRGLPEGGTLDGSTIETQFLDLNDANTGTTELLLRFPVEFGEVGEGIIPIGEEVVKAELVMVTNSPIFFGSGNAQTGGAYAIHQVTRDWDTSTYFGNLGPVVGSDIESAVTHFTGMGWGSASYIDITSVVRNWRAGSDNFGVNVKPNTTDGWQPFFPGVVNNPRLRNAAPMLRIQTAILTPSLFDAWAAEHNIPSSNFNEDADGDGIVALLEYALGYDPLVKDKLPMLQSDLSLTFPKGAAAVADPSVVYKLELSSDLKDWTPWTPTVDSDTEISGQLPSDMGTVFGRLNVDYVPVSNE
ncbi:Ig-like domain-containing protein [Haloferula chungangensis]|uniref:Ig-like domain-containing protein n=1 Tax=Haloferula chungangensis TaxID=1048331 RepID=A0ABW2L604_9BACT